jgi:hypothetical protein
MALLPGEELNEEDPFTGKPCFSMKSSGLVLTILSNGLYSVYVRQLWS